MAKNKNLVQAKANRKDEFYTRIEDIENELKHYKKYFENSVILCNCDDPFESNFFKYFAMNFNVLKLKKLIATCYAASKVVYTQLSFFDDGEVVTIDDNGKRPYKIEITEVKDENGDGAIDLSDVEYLIRNKKNVLTQLKGDGDFRSDECVELLKECDIVVTNPPFSLYKEFVPLMMEYNKKFIIIGSMNTCHYKEIFPLIKGNKMWSGYSFNKTMEFNMPDDYEGETRDSSGVKIAKVPKICWFTNLDIDKRHEEIILYKLYNEEEYPKIDNYDAIYISKVNEIPMDYDGIMGVPESFLDKYNPEQFEIVGMSSATNDDDYLRLDKDYSKYIGYKRNGSKNGRTGSTFGNAPVLEGDNGKGDYYVGEGRRIQAKFARIFIRRKI